MLAIIATGGKQYVVKTGDKLKVEKISAEEGSQIKFDNVLLTANDDGTDIQIGCPRVSDASVAAAVLKQGRLPKVRVEKFKRKVRYHKVYGHRQDFTEVQFV